MLYARLYYHILWAIRDRQPIIDADVARIVEVAIRATCRDVGAHVFAFGAMPDHVHLAVSIPPKHAVATIVGRIKGASSHAVNAAQPNRGEPFAWQIKYGVLSFGERAREDVAAYVNDQPHRHANRQIVRGLERWIEPT